MQDRELNPKKLARVFRLLASRIERDPELASSLELALNGANSRRTSRKRREPTRLEFDLFDVYAREGESGLYRRLEILELTVLKGIIATNNFDPSKLADKWRSRERLVNLIIDRVAARSEKGRVFHEYR